MHSRSSAHRLAERIFAEETSEGGPSAEAIAAIVRIYEKLARAMSPIVGEAGFEGMMGRAIQKAASLHRGLAAVVDLKGDAFLSGLVTTLTKEEVASIRATGVTVLGEFLALLSTFIGSDLALRLLRSTWPEPIAHAIDSAEKS